MILSEDRDLGSGKERWLSLQNQRSKRVIQSIKKMAYTPSKDYRRREREQKKQDKRREREAAKAAKAAEAEKQKAAEQAANKTETED